MRVISGPNNIH